MILECAYRYRVERSVARCGMSQSNARAHIRGRPQQYFTSRARTDIIDRVEIDVPYHAQPSRRTNVSLRLSTVRTRHPPLVAHSSPSARCLAWCRSTSSWVKRKDLPQDAHSYAVRLPRALDASAGADTVDTDGVGSREEMSAAAAGGSCPGCPRGGDGGRPRGEDAPGRSSATPSGSGRAAVSR